MRRETLYDEDLHLVLVTYRGVLTPDVTARNGAGGALRFQSRHRLPGGQSLRRAAQKQASGDATGHRSKWCVSPQEERKRIVKSEQEALAFLNAWVSRLT